MLVFTGSWEEARKLEPEAKKGTLEAALKNSYGRGSRQRQPPRIFSPSEYVPPSRQAQQPTIQQPTTQPSHPVGLHLPSLPECLWNNGYSQNGYVNSTIQSFMYYSSSKFIESTQVLEGMRCQLGICCLM